MGEKSSSSKVRRNADVKSHAHTKSLKQQTHQYVHCRSLRNINVRSANITMLCAQVFRNPELSVVIRRCREHSTETKHISYNDFLTIYC